MPSWFPVACERRSAPGELTAQERLVLFPAEVEGNVFCLFKCRSGSSWNSALGMRGWVQAAALLISSRKPSAFSSEVQTRESQK